MRLSTAERNKRKRERKKKAREATKKQEEQVEKISVEEATNPEATTTVPDVEIEYVTEDIIVPFVKSDADGSSSSADESLLEQLRKFQAKAAVSTGVVDEEKARGMKQQQQKDVFDNNGVNDGEFGQDENDWAGSSGGELMVLSKRKLREKLRPTVAELKRRVAWPDLVEAHDITAPDPEFLIQLKATPGSVPVPRHWGRKRKYLQGKRGFEKPPFKLPDFIVNTGITEIRDTVAEKEAEQSAKQKNRARVAPKMGAIDVDYRTLHDAFFKYQTKPTNLTKFGDLYHEGKELEVDIHSKSTGKLSQKLRDALGMTSENSPPPWLLNMQRYGPPPAYPGLKIPGLNAPLPSEECQYGYHPGGWGKPPVDPYGRPLYGGNPFDRPGTATNRDSIGNQTLVTSDGKLIQKEAWGELPAGVVEEEEEESSSEDDNMQDSDGEEEGEEAQEAEPNTNAGGMESVLPLPPPTAVAANLRKDDTGGETPAPPAKALYRVLEQTKAGHQAGAVFTSEVTYAVPQAGAESVLAKTMPANNNDKDGNESGGKRKRADEDEQDDLGKNFKF